MRVERALVPVAAIVLACASLLHAPVARAAGRTAGGAAGACSFRPSQHVALLGDTDDPDVLVWDSRFRLAAYQIGSWDADRALLPHARVVGAGTRAVVIACAVGFVHHKFRSGTEDAVGIIIESGPYRGDSGWVLAEDVRSFWARRR